MTDPVPLGKRASAAHGTSRAVAARSVEHWRRIEDVLAPVIGHAGVHAVYVRSLSLTRGAIPWLPVVAGDAPGAISFAPLHAALAAQPAPESLAADDALRQAFGDVLTSLLGSPLTARLLAKLPRTTSDGAGETHSVP